MSHPVPALLLLALAPIALAACEPVTSNPDPTGAGTQPSLPERLWNVNRDLALGDRGDDVRAVQDYLTAHGYFPSDELPRRFPSWRPVVSTGPAQPGVFDASTAAAVRAFQDMANSPAPGQWTKPPGRCCANLAAASRKASGRRTPTASSRTWARAGTASPCSPGPIRTRTLPGVR